MLPESYHYRPQIVRALSNVARAAESAPIITPFGIIDSTPARSALLTCALYLDDAGSTFRPVIETIYDSTGDHNGTQDAQECALLVAAACGISQDEVHKCR